jgi:hypothetical protein
MANLGYEDKPLFDVGKIKGAVGVLLLVAGLVLAGWVACKAHGLFTRPEELERFRAAIPQPAEADNLDPKHAAAVREVLAYAVPLGCLLPLTFLATGLIGGGGRFLCGDVQKVLTKLSSIETRIVGGAKSGGNG